MFLYKNISRFENFHCTLSSKFAINVSFLYVNISQGSVKPIRLGYGDGIFNDHFTAKYTAAR